MLAVGCEYNDCKPDYVEIKQKGYTDQKDEDMATPEQKEENRTSVGCLSWLFAVSQAQRRQQAPTVKDFKNTNKIVNVSLKHQDCGIRLSKIEEKNICIIAYHDAGWGNVSPEDEEPEDQQWIGERATASRDGPALLSMKESTFILVDWKSKASHRVCRSTFAGETVAGCEAFENSVFLRSLLLSMLTGQRFNESEAGKMMDLHLIADCRSLYDHVHREGLPRAPSEKRLAIDLAGLRQGLMIEAKHQWAKKYRSEARPSPQCPLRPPLHWLPTGDQWANLLTKVMVATDWWEVNKRWLTLPLKGMVQSP